MNPYQRIPGKQEGHIDTAAKFEQMVDGIDLDGLTVLDVGCNLGEMSRMAAARGAKVKGIDLNPEHIHDARKLTEGGNPLFEVQDGYRATGHYDLAIVSACFHYFQDPERLLAQLARVADRVRVDVWGYEASDLQAMRPTARGLLIPSWDLFRNLAHYSYDCRLMFDVLSPDDSHRILFDLQNPTPDRAAATLIYGPGGSGKTTRGKELERTGREHLQLDSVFGEWRINHDELGWSVLDVTAHLQGNAEAWADYLTHARGYLHRWIGARQGLDLVIEGYEAVDEEYRAVVLEELARFGYGDVKEMETNREFECRDVRGAA